MNKDHISFLACPECGSDLDIRSFTGESDVEEGILTCCKCNCFFPVISGIPRLLGQSQLVELVSGYRTFIEKYGSHLKQYKTPNLGLFPTDKRIASGFNFEWSHHSGILPEHELELLHVYGYLLSKESFKNKFVLDAGCGQGRFSHFALKYGAKLVISMDLGEQVLLARRNLAGNSNSLIIQASIFKPPVRKNILDMVISIGVIHHLPDPEKGFQTLYGLLKPSGEIFIWVYGYSSIIPIIRLLRLITRGKSDDFNRIFAIPFAILLYALTRIYKLLKAARLNFLAKMIPWNMYHDRGFSNIWTITFDKLNSFIAVYYKKEDIEGWIARTPGKADAILSERYPGKSGSSWRLLIRKA